MALFGTCFTPCRLVFKSPEPVTKVFANGPPNYNFNNSWPNNNNNDNNNNNTNTTATQKQHQHNHNHIHSHYNNKHNNNSSNNYSYNDNTTTMTTTTLASTTVLFNYNYKLLPSKAAQMRYRSTFKPIRETVYESSNSQDHHARSRCQLPRRRSIPYKNLGALH